MIIDNGNIIANSIEDVLGNDFCKGYSIDLDKDYCVEWVSAKKLLVSQRLDLIIKYKYVESIEKSFKCVFFKDMYAAHINAFSHGTYTEPGQELTKNSLEKYESVFKELIQSIKEDGLDPKKSVIPVGKHDAIMDGAHRIAVAAYFNQMVPIIRFPELVANNDARFFLENYLEEKYVDYAVYQYSKLKDNISVIVLWPKAAEKPECYERAYKMINQLKVVYHRKLTTNINMLRNLMIQVYSGFDWLGAMDNGFKGASRYAEQCYSNKGQIEIFVIEDSTIEVRNQIKGEVRKLFGLGNSSMHSTDNKDEAINILQMLLNNNSRHFLRYSKPDKYKNFNEMVTTFANELENENRSFEKYALDSGATLASYGLRNTFDIDYISKDKLETENTLFEQHGMEYYKMNLDDILYNPENHYYYYGLKFICLNCVKSMKEARYQRENNSKDSDDIKLIDSIHEDRNIKEMLATVLLPVKRELHNTTYRIEMFLSTSIIFRPARFIYHKIKRTPFHG